MKDKTYAEKLRDPRWQRKRLEIMKRDRFTCKLCGDTKTQLHVHHKKYINGNDPWDYDNKLLVTLCEDCHTEIEDLKKENPDILLEFVKVYKSDNWVGGSKIMFTSTPGKCSMVIYDDSGNWLCGFNLTHDIPNIIKILKQAQNG